MDIKITKDADALLCLLYKHYRQQLKNDVSKSQAKMFGSCDEIQELIAPKWTVDYVNETLSELSQAELINCLYGDGVVQACGLTNDGIIYMENRFKDGLDSVLDYLGKIKSFLPI